MSKTNLELVQHCEKALKEKWYYLWGSYAQLSTQNTINSLLKQWPTNEKYRAEFEKTIGKTRLCDCYGLVKSFLWWTGDKTDPKVIASQDVNTASAFSKAKEKGALSTLPEIPGIILWMEGHVGVYMGNGRFIECCFSARGMQEGTISNGKITKGNKFTHWFKDINIEYEAKNNLIDKLFSKGYITDKAYWLNVLNGKQSVSLDYLKVLLERAVK